MTRPSPQVKAALLELSTALRRATEAGALDDLADFLHPDIIDQFCDAVEEAIAHESLGGVRHSESW